MWLAGTRKRGRAQAFGQELRRQHPAFRRVRDPVWLSRARVALLDHMRVSADTRERETWQPGAESGFSGISLATPNGIVGGDGEPRHSDPWPQYWPEFLADLFKRIRP